MPDGSRREASSSDPLRAAVPVFALVVAVVAAVTDPASGAEIGLGAIAVAAFAAWAYLPGVPLPAMAFAVLVPVVLAQRSGAFEPLLFEACLVAFVAGRWAAALGRAVALGLLCVAAPVAAILIQDPPEVAVGIWLMGIAFSWVIGVAAARQRQLTLELEASRRELAEQAVFAERRRVARDVHDLVGHGLAAVMLQITSARHVLRRDPAAAEDALKVAEEVGRRSMRELGRTVALLRSDDEATAATPVPSAAEIPALVDDARAGGLDVDLETHGDLSLIAPGVGLALYRIAQEALANAARHAPQARTVVGIEVADGRAGLVAETTGPTRTERAEPDRPGFGLVGMRERATSLGGEFVAGPVPGGWRMRCAVPLAADAEEARSR